ncbi:MAG: KH domain-containing protein [Methanobacteriaceae archaeon]|jgi:ribosomal RNA assembly protein|nr:KH domain-containing protein [Methanobacteriaceae archaeon]
MPETDYIKVPQDRVGVIIGTNGKVKKAIEKETETRLEIDSNDGIVTIIPKENMEDPLGGWNANHIVKAIGRGFNPEKAIKLTDDDIYLEIIKLPLIIGKSKKALARHKGRIIGKDGKTREIIVDMAEVDMAIYGKTVSFIGKLENIMIAKEAVKMILNGSRHKTVYNFLEQKQNELKVKEFESVVGINNDEIEFKDDIELDIKK